jgi:hypothetical protein
MAKIPRVVGIFVSWAVWTVATMNLPRTMHSNNFGFELAVWAGFILGNYCYSQLWMDEGRQRERERAAQERQR